MLQAFSLNGENARYGNARKPRLPRPRARGVLLWFRGAGSQVIGLTTGMCASACWRSLAAAYSCELLSMSWALVAAQAFSAA